jgi:TRAP-type C4-dicarboxylate transport system permease small subunit
VRLLTKIYDGIIHGSAVVAGALLVAMMLMIFVDVVLRNLGTQSSSHLFTFTEYFLLMVPCLGAPWLVRERGHVYIEIVLMQLGPGPRRLLLRLVLATCIATCLVLAWYGFEATWTSFRLSEKDSRSFDMPRWLVVGFIPASMALMASEFLRFLIRGESPYAGMPIGEGKAD